MSRQPKIPKELQCQHPKCTRRKNSDIKTKQGLLSVCGTHIGWAYLAKVRIQKKKQTLEDILVNGLPFQSMKAEQEEDLENEDTD